MARQIIELTVQRAEWLTSNLRRVHLVGEGISLFTPSKFTDSYVKLHFGPDGDSVTRTYTVRAVDAERRELAIDFVVHGDDGIAGTWAQRAEPGHTLRLAGPGGAYRPDPTADWHLLAGDESALPAIAAALEVLAPDAVGQAFIEVEDVEGQLPIAAPPGVTVTWVHRRSTSSAAEDGGSGVNSPLVAAVRGATWLAGTPHVFIHGEARTVMHGLRPYIRKERGVPAARASISGYWRQGRTEEGFRTWKRELTAAEA